MALVVARAARPPTSPKMCVPIMPAAEPKRNPKSAGERNMRKKPSVCSASRLTLATLNRLVCSLEAMMAGV